MNKEIINKFPENKDLFFNLVKGKRSLLITYVNSYSYLYLRKNQDLYNNVDIITSDGFLLKFLLRFIYGKRTPLLSPDFSSYFMELFQWISRKNKSVFFVGSTSEALQLSLQNIKKNFPELKIVGNHHGYFDNRKKTILIERISSLSPDFVIVGMGTPKQELFLVELSKSGWTGVGITCGALLSQSAKKLNYYPKLFKTLKMRWVYRIIDEPKLLWRYMVLYPWSVFLFLKDNLLKLNIKSY